MNGWSLQKDDNPTYLGVTFDTRLTWKKQTEKCLKRDSQRTALIKKMAGSKWGANHNILNKNYQGYVRPVQEYGISSQTAPTNFPKVSATSKPQVNDRRYEINPHSGDGNPVRPPVHRG